MMAGLTLSRRLLPRIARPIARVHSYNRTASTVQTVQQPTDTYSPGLEGTINPVLFHVQPVEAENPYWKTIPKWREIGHAQFLSHKWQMSNSVQSERALCELLRAVLPATVPPQIDMADHLRIKDVHTPEDFIQRVQEGIRKAPMAVRLSPHIIGMINWQDPLNDPVRRQFIPLSSPLGVDHPAADLDPMHESEYSPVEGLIHRYPDRALFMGEFPIPSEADGCDEKKLIRVVSDLDLSCVLSFLLPLLHRRE